MTQTVVFTPSGPGYGRSRRGGIGFTTLSVFIATVSGLAAIGQPAAGATPAGDDLAKRGAYLAAISDCNGCHTPFIPGPNGAEPDFSRLLSGHPQTLKLPPPPPLGEGGWGWIGSATNTAFAGPWGISYTANLTPDPETGLGTWTEAMFIDTIRMGKHRGTGRPLLPPMPWPSYSHMTDDDLRAIFAYLRTITPIANRVPAPASPPAKP
ncbi:MAG: c-type cytochrome [Gammaproteobacteria bacterium]|nr:c-type cytochrome [Gammaproteobacteria bacterium]MCP5425645.1 c-type cytochrome [Gammaproteobacteria bacterium]MCP5458957.1 c-type cytochrome [Gammaproteobacteria bacterium]